MFTELKVIGSYSQAVAVAKALCEKQFGQENALRRLLPGANCTMEDYGKVAPTLQNILSVEVVRDSRVVNLKVTHSDPQLAALIANTTARVYTERNLERRLSTSDNAATWLGDEYASLIQQLKESEQALIDFKKANNVVAVAIEDQQNDLSSRRKKLSDELNGVQVRLITLRAQREEYSLLRSDDPFTDITPGVGDNPVLVRLKEMYVDQTAKLLELKGKYLEKHPAIVAQETRLAAIRVDIKREATQAYKIVDAQFQALNKQEHDLKAALDVATHEALQLENRAIEYNRLKRNFDRLSKLSEQVGGRERETSLAGHLKTNNVHILDAALVPSAPIAPNVSRSVGLSVVVALVLAIALAFLLDMLDLTVKTQDDIERTIGLTFLGLIPTIAVEKLEAESSAPVPLALANIVKKGSKDLYVLAHPKSTVAECCRAIRTNLLFMSPDRPSKSLLVTSAGPQEGKTTTAVNLAISLAQSGLKVLLVDTDMRRPRLHHVFGIPSMSDGLSKSIVGEADPFDMVRETGVPNMWLLPCGATPPNPAELLHADRFHKLIHEFTQRYDRVIFDSPPLGAVTDAAILARMVGGTIMVAKGGRTSKDALARAARHLAGDGSINILGCILNDLDLTRPGSYGYYYYSRYGYYYREDEKKSVAKESAS
jgi:capsular exopolysaccharide synthesis family protein